MSSAAAGTGPAPRAPGTARDPTAAEIWRAARVPVLIGGFVLLVAVVVGVLGSGERTGMLDPRATDRAGSRALAEVLRGQGLDVTLVETTDAAVAATLGAGRAGGTLLVAFPERLAPEQLDRVGGLIERTSADLVLVAPQEAALSVLVPGVAPAGTSEVAERPPACTLPAARRAGPAELGGVLYATRVPERAEAALCYPVSGPAALVVLDRGRSGTVTVLGDPAPLTNDRLDDAGNAALALNLLGGNPRLVWYLPSLADVPPGAQRSLRELVPPGVLFALAQVFVAAVLLALWRGRRLGPVVAEPLPVVVRAAEAVEGRARLYRRVRAQDRAADALRRAARDRLVRALGLPRAAQPPAIVDALTRRTGRAPAAVGDLLYGAAPADDAALVRLADDLDRLEQEVRGQ